MSYHGTLCVYTNQAPDHVDDIEYEGPGHAIANLNTCEPGLYLLTTTLPKKGRNVVHVARVVYLMPGDLIITTGTLRYSWLHGIYRRMPGDEPAKWSIPLTPSNIDSARSVLCFRYGKPPPVREKEFQEMLLKWDMIKEKPKPNTVVAPPVKAKA